MLKWVIFFSLWITTAFAQGCGSHNPNCLVPTRPVGDSTNAAASTAFVTRATGGVGNTNQIPVFPGGGGAPVATDATTWFDRTCGNTVGMIWARFTGGWVCGFGSRADVTWWGAVSDSSTDSSGAVMNTVAACLARRGNGCTIYFPGSTGVYCLKSVHATSHTSTAAVALDDGVVTFTVEGDGQFASTLSSCGASLTPMLIDCPACMIRELSILGQGGGGPGDVTFGSNYPALSMQGDNGGIQRIMHITAQGGSAAILINANDDFIENVSATQSYGNGNITLTANGARISRGSVDQNWPVVLPQVNSVTLSTWAANSFVGSSFTASISGTTMSVSAVSAGRPVISELVKGAGVAAGTQILACPSGNCNGATGAYTVSVSQSAVSQAMTGVGDLFITNGYLIQVATAGTTGNSNPALQNYGTLIQDNTAQEQFVCLVGCAGIFIDVGAGETAIKDHDVSTDRYYGVFIHGPQGHNTIGSMTCGGEIVACVYVNDGGWFGVYDSHMTAGVELNQSFGIETATGHLNGASIVGNEFIGGNVGGIAMNLTSGDYNTVIGNYCNSLTNCLSLQAGIDYVAAVGNVAYNNTTPFNNGSSGTHNIWVNNPGGSSNPEGYFNVTSPPNTGNPWVNFPWPSTVVLSAASISLVTQGVVGGTQARVCFASPCKVELGPNEQVTPTYTGTLSIYGVGH